MLLSVHQPTYLPWLGLFHKIAVSDLFLIYDDVPYSRSMWYNRNKILGANGPILISVPVTFRKSQQTIHRDVAIDNSKPWRKKHWRSIEQAYGSLPFFGDYADDLRTVYEAEWERLADLNERLLRLLLGFLRIDTPVRRASSYSFVGAKSDRLVDICLKLGADAHLFGALGKDYADTEAFREKGIAALFQDYRHPTYEQRKAPFVSHLSVIDLLFRRGAASREIILSNNVTREDYLALAQGVTDGGGPRPDDSSSRDVLSAGECSEHD